MNATRVSRLPIAILALFAGITIFAPAARAQDATLEEIKQGQEELTQQMSDLRQELTALKTELAKVRNDINKTLATVRSQGKRRAPRRRPAQTMVGKEAPEFQVTTYDGKKTTVGGKRDKPQVLMCYASWCGFCKKSLPWIEGVYTEYKDKGVDVLLLNLDQRGKGGRARTEEQTIQTYQGLDLTMPMTMNTDDNNTSKVGAAYKARSFPTLFVLGPSGKVESVHIGAKQGLADTIGKELDQLLAGKSLVGTQ